MTTRQSALGASTPFVALDPRPAEQRATDLPPHAPRTSELGAPRTSELGALLAAGGLQPVYQPVVSLDRLGVVGVEALVRGPAGSALHAPQALFAAARAEDRVGELDWASRAAALHGVLDGGLRAPAAVFLNAEPQGLGRHAPEGFDELADEAAAEGLQVVLEITERALTDEPAQLLRAVERVRDRGWLVALDDVGAEPASLALLPFLAPDVVKLDLRLVQDRTTVEAAGIVNAVLAHAERTGAAILAEGIETRRHLDLARSMGATLGQGWYFGRPAPLRPDLECLPLPVTTSPPPPPPATPWQLVRDLPSVRRAGRDLLVALSKTLEQRALADADGCVVLSTFQYDERLTPGTRRRYERLAGRATYVAVIGTDVAAEPAAGVTGHRLRAGDPLVEEWDVAVVGPHFATALVAREGPPVDGERSFDHVVTYDRDRVLSVARSLMLRLGGG